jgi:hypothetical protein
MWFSKIAIIMTVFSALLTFSGYYVDQAFGTTLFDSFTTQSLDEILERVDRIDEEPSIDLIFGDFLAAVRVVFGVLVGDAVFQPLSALPNFNEMYLVFAKMIFGFSSVFLWVYIVAGRVL